MMLFVYPTRNLSVKLLGKEPCPNPTRVRPSFAPMFRTTRPGTWERDHAPPTRAGPRACPDGPRRLRDRPMTAPEGPYTALQAPKTAEDSPRTGPRKNKKGTFNQKLERPAPSDRQAVPDFRDHPQGQEDDCASRVAAWAGELPFSKVASRGREDNRATRAHRGAPCAQLGRRPRRPGRLPQQTRPARNVFMLARMPHEPPASSTVQMQSPHRRAHAARGAAAARRAQAHHPCPKPMHHVCGCARHTPWWPPRRKVSLALDRDCGADMFPDVCCHVRGRTWHTLRVPRTWHAWRGWSMRYTWRTWST